VEQTYLRRVKTWIPGDWFAYPEPAGTVLLLLEILERSVQSENDKSLYLKNKFM